MKRRDFLKTIPASAIILSLPAGGDSLAFGGNDHVTTSAFVADGTYSITYITKSPNDLVLTWAKRDIHDLSLHGKVEIVIDNDFVWVKQDGEVIASMQHDGIVSDLVLHRHERYSHGIADSPRGVFGSPGT